MKRNMSHVRARRVEANIQYDEPWCTRLDFFEALAALSSLHSAEVQRKVTGANKPLYRLLWNAAAPHRIEWLWNVMWMRARMTAAELDLLPSGTTSNESSHAEINNWFRQTQQIHQATLRLKLQILQLAKLLPHNAAAYHPTVRQATAGYVLARVAMRTVWHSEQWTEWCASLNRGCRPSKTDLPLHRARLAQADTVRQWVMKRPARATRMPRKKRTPYNMRRGGEIRTGGVKPSVYKKPSLPYRRPAADRKPIIRRRPAATCSDS